MKESNLANILVDNLSRELIFAIREALLVGAQRAYLKAKDKDPGHLANALGMERHFCMNETFYDALSAQGCEPPKLKGNDIVVGTSGCFRLARSNDNNGQFNAPYRSKRKQSLGADNIVMESIIQPDLFNTYDDVPIKGSVFFVAKFSGSPSIHPESPTSIDLVMPSHDMKSAIFSESLELFLRRYDVIPVQIDTAIVKLKPGIIKKDGSGDGLK